MSVHLVLDTHALYWFLHSDPRLGAKVKALASEPTSIVYVLLIVLAELIFLHRKTLPGLSARQQIEMFSSVAGGGLLGIDSETVQNLPAQLEMHDGMIVTACLRLQQELSEPVFPATRDQRILNSGLLNTIW